MNTVKQLLYWLIAGSEGGINRGRILSYLHEEPGNANQLSDALNLDYKTVRHHLDVLQKNNLITTMGAKYGKIYFISKLLEENWMIFEEIWVRIGEKQVNKQKNRGK